LWKSTDPDAIFLKVALDLEGGIESPKADRIYLDRAQPIIKSRVKQQALEVMDQEAQSPEESHVTTLEDQEREPAYVVTPLIESAFGRYLREYRLLNSLLIALFSVTIFLILIWGLVVYVAGGGEGTADFADAGVAPLQQKQPQQKVKLMQRQKKAQPTVKQTFRATAISDIAMPDLNDLDVKDLAPVIAASAPSAGNTGIDNDAMKNALKGIGLALPKTMQQRCDPKKRIARLRAGGGKDITEKAIIRGLTWLKNTQGKDGSWGGNAKNKHGEPSPTDKNAMTGMALLSFLGHCELQDSPEFGPAVQKAISFLTSTPPEKMTGGGGGAYSHPIRAYALCEAYTMTKIKKLELFAKRAAEAIVKGQNERGGWAYSYGKGAGAHVDLSVTGWNIQALKAAALTGISIDGLDEAMDNAVAYTKRCQDKTGKFAYSEGGGGKPSLTGTGVLCLQIWKEAKSQEAKMGLEWIIANQAQEWKRVNVYEWYYHAQACFQATGVSGGAKYWKAWNKNFQAIVCGAQDSDGHWDGPLGHGGTDVFTTTMTILMLEVYYRYMPTGKTG